jgi:cytoskeletal protein CcmA (bactofilin family)
MKHIRLFVVLITLAAAALLSGCVGQIVTSGDYTLGHGQTLRGDLLVTSGNITLAEDSRVNGTVFMTSGNLDVEGQVSGDVLMTSGNVMLGPDAVVRGDILGTSGNVRQAAGAQVEGQVSTDAPGASVMGGYFTGLLAQVCGLPLILLGALIYLLVGRGRSKPAAETAPTGDASGDAAQKLAQLKAMVDEGLINEAEYEAKKSEILARM